MADCFTEERFQLMRALGAEIDVVPSVEGRPKVTAKDIENMVARAGELARAPGHYATDQFNNPYIVSDHRDRLGREIWEQTAGRVTAFCQGMERRAPSWASRTRSSPTACSSRRTSLRGRLRSQAASAELRDPGLDGDGDAALVPGRSTTSSRSATARRWR